jgi:hypothetical protein
VFYYPDLCYTGTTQSLDGLSQGAQCQLLGACRIIASGPGACKGEFYSMAAPYRGAMDPTEAEIQQRIDMPTLNCLLGMLAEDTIVRRVTERGAFT